MKTYHDIAGDGGSDVLGQVDAQRRAIGRALAGVGTVLAVGSGKGGVGKSTVTMALAQSLIATGQRVAILDADFNGPCQARLAGLETAPWLPGPNGLSLPRRPDGLGVASFGSLLADDQPLDFQTVSHGEQQTWRGTREFALLGQLLGSVDWGELDLLLVDLPPGAERTVQYAEFLAPLRERVAFVMVSVPSDIARGVVARSLTALQRACGETGGRFLGTVENMAGYLCPGCGEIQPLFPGTARSGEELPGRHLASLPFDPALAALCDAGWPVDERSAATHAADALAETVLGLLAPVPAAR